MGGADPTARNRTTILSLGPKSAAATDASAAVASRGSEVSTIEAVMVRGRSGLEGRSGIRGLAGGEGAAVEEEGRRGGGEEAILDDWWLCCWGLVDFRH